MFCVYKFSVSKELSTIGGIIFSFLQVGLVISDYDLKEGSRRALNLKSAGLVLGVANML